MNRYRRYAGLFALILALPSSVTAQDGRTFFEPFDQLSDSFWFTSSGWANGDHQSCLWHSDRVEIDNGTLLLSLTADAKEDRAFSCGEVQTEARYGYGTFEARMKVPYAEGMNANFFTFIGAPQDLPHNEIDFEFIAPQEPVLQTNFHTARSSEHTELHPMPDDGAFRNYAFIWEPDSIRWYIDGELIREVTGGDLPDEPQKMYLSLWSTETLIEWMGPYSGDDGPQVLEVDWVAYTGLGDDCAFDQSVLCEAGVTAGQ